MEKEQLNILTLCLDQIDSLIDGVAGYPQSVDGWPLSVLLLPMLII
jgi:hypothetical protein